MTVRNTTYLKGRFENGDIPTQTDYEDVFDSLLNLGVSAEQSADSNIRTTKQLVANSVSADNVVVASAATCAAVWVTDRYIHSNKVNVSAAAGTQAGATRLTKDVSYVFGNDILGFGVVMATAEPGRVQHIINTGTTALSVFPASGCNFVGTAENAAIKLAANGCMIVVHVGVSAYGVTRTQGV